MNNNKNYSFILIISHLYLFEYIVLSMKHKLDKHEKRRKKKCITSKKKKTL